VRKNQNTKFEKEMSTKTVFIFCHRCQCDRQTKKMLLANCLGTNIVLVSKSALFLRQIKRFSHQTKNRIFLFNKKMQNNIFARHFTIKMTKVG